MRRSKRTVLSTTIVALLIGIMAVFSLAMPIHEVGATVPPPCQAIRTDDAHKSYNYAGQPVVRVHAVTDCRNVPGVTSVDVTTALYLNGSFAAAGSSSGVNYAKSTADDACRSGYYTADSSHNVTYNGVRYYFYTVSPHTTYVSCP